MLQTALKVVAGAWLGLLVTGVVALAALYAFDWVTCTMRRPRRGGRVRQAQTADMAAVLALLERARLPTTDLHSAQGLKVWVLEGQRSVLGVIALERFGSEALLRSLAIAPEYQRRGFGQKLVARLEQEARESGIKKLVLLTETAEPFFRRLGYSVVNRRSVSPQVQQSDEFQSLRPVSATC